MGCNRHARPCVEDVDDPRHPHFGALLVDHRAAVVQLAAPLLHELQPLLRTARLGRIGAGGAAGALLPLGQRSEGKQQDREASRRRPATPPPASTTLLHQCGAGGADVGRRIRHHGRIASSRCAARYRSSCGERSTTTAGGAAAAVVVAPRRLGDHRVGDDPWRTADPPRSARRRQPAAPAPGSSQRRTAERCGSAPRQHGRLALQRADTRAASHPSGSWQRPPNAWRRRRSSASPTCGSVLVVTEALDDRPAPSRRVPRRAAPTDAARIFAPSPPGQARNGRGRFGLDSSATSPTPSLDVSGSAEFLSHRFARAEDARADGADRTIHRYRDLVVIRPSSSRSTMPCAGLGQPLDRRFTVRRLLRQQHAVGVSSVRSECRTSKFSASSISVSVRVGPGALPPQVVLRRVDARYESR